MDVAASPRTAARAPTVELQQAAEQKALLQLSTSSIGESSSPSVKQTNNTSSPVASRRPLFPLPSSSPSSYGGDSEGDCDELASMPSCRRPLKRMRFSSSRPSLLGPSRVFSSGLSGSRPPPIRTVLSLEGPREAGLNMASPPTMAGGGSGGNAAGLSVLLSRSPAFAVAPPTPSSRSVVPRSDSCEKAPRRYPVGSRRRGAAAPPMSRVAPKLYVGDAVAAASLPMLLEAGITHVLNCTAQPNALEGTSGAPSFLSLGLMDNTSDAPRMQSALAIGVNFITDAIASNGTVLVHCHRGISRSATLAIAYLVKTTQQPAEHVFEGVRACRPIIDPNLGYMVSLMEWERKHLPKATPPRNLSLGSVAAEASGAASPVIPVHPLSRAG